MERKNALTSTHRKAHTRTKIQLGGLLIKAGLVDALNISLGDDLQLESHALDKAALLLGILMDAYETFVLTSINDPQKIQTHALKGKLSLKYNATLEG